VGNVNRPNLSFKIQDKRGREKDGTPDPLQ
jgi:hypothetical protein